jgi:hypothetical protein
MARLRAGAPPRSRSPGGPGPGKTCAKLGLERRWLSISIGWLSVDSSQTKLVPGRAHNPSALILHSHLLALSTTVPHRATRSVSERLSWGEETEPASPLGAPRRRACPPLGGRDTIEWPHGGVSSCPCALTWWWVLSTLEVSSLSTHRRAMVGVFYFHRGTNVLSSSDMGPECIDGDSVSSRTTSVVTQLDKTR